MHIINPYQIIILSLSALLSFGVLANSEHLSIKSNDSVIANQPMLQHLHGHEIYQAIVLDQTWQKLNHHNRSLSRIESWVGTDENKLLIEARLDNQAHHQENRVALSYGRKIADFWDFTIGIQYQNQQDLNRIGMLLGLRGLAPYFFETDFSVYIGQNQKAALSIESHRDLLLTQKLITQPYIDFTWILQDKTRYAEKKGLTEFRVGLQTRYEINKTIMPYIDIAYHDETTTNQSIKLSDSWRGLVYGFGVMLKF